MAQRKPPSQVDISKLNSLRVRLLENVHEGESRRVSVTPAQRRGCPMPCCSYHFRITRSAPTRC
jgi:hypothetical protein